MFVVSYQYYCHPPMVWYNIVNCFI